MENYIYILPFKDGKYFKIGITNNKDLRLNKHNKSYSIDFSKSIIVKSKSRRLAISLETELLFISKNKPKNNTFEKIDGYTEIREICDLQKVLDYVKSKPKEFGYKITKYETPKPKIKETTQKHIEFDLNSYFKNNLIDYINDDFCKIYVCKNGINLDKYLNKNDYKIINKNFDYVYFTSKNDLVIKDFCYKNVCGNLSFDDYYTKFNFFIEFLNNKKVKLKNNSLIFNSEFENFTYLAKNFQIQNDCFNFIESITFDKNINYLK